MLVDKFVEELDEVLERRPHLRPRWGPGQGCVWVLVVLGWVAAHWEVAAAVVVEVVVEVVVWTRT